MNYLIIILLFLFILSPYNAHSLDCSDPKNQHEINQCSSERFKSVDAKLNQDYKKAMALLPGKVQEYLKQSQLLWIGYKEKHCDTMTLNWEGGSGQSAAKAGCLARLTAFQNKELKMLMENYGL